MSRLVALALALGLALLGAGGAAAATAKTYTYTIPYGTPLSKLPGATTLVPKKDVTAISLTMAPVTYSLTTPAGLQIEFTAPGFVNDKTKKPALMGPTIRVSRGSTFSVQLTNMLVDANPMDNHTMPFYGPMDTNLHAHGIHSDPGVPDQANAATYTGEDNIFVTVKARKTDSDAPNMLAYTNHISTEHLPGMHWIHPHKHGSTTIQTGTAHTIVVVDDDHPVWLPGAGCQQVVSTLTAADDVILDLELLFFKNVANTTGIWGPINWNSNVDDASYEYASALAQNPYCCASIGPDGRRYRGAMTEGLGQNLFLVNGGSAPTMDLPQNTWQRWRFLYSGAKGYVALALLNSTGQVASDCELMLISKDGLYLPEIPRRVEGLVLPSGGRLELLVRCSGPVGSTYTLSAGAAAVKVFSDTNFGNQFFPTGNPYLLTQELLTTITIKASPGKPSRKPALVQALTPETCVPKRPSYAADLRDAAIVAAGKTVDAVLDKYNVSFTFNRQYACEVNGDVFSFPDANPLPMPLGKIVEWGFNDVYFHPLHTHVNPFQFTDYRDVTIDTGNRLTNFFRVGDWYDTFLFPLYTPFNDGGIKLRFQPGQFTGYSVMHCHYLQHEDTGCMKVIAYQCPGYTTVQPSNGLCPGFIPPVPGTVTLA